MSVSTASPHSARTRCLGISHVSRTSGSVSVSSPRPNRAGWPRLMSLRAFAGVTGSLTRPKPSTSRLRCSGRTVSSARMSRIYGVTCRAGRRSDPAGVGEAEASVAGCAACQHGGEHVGARVVVVVELCGFLAGVGAEDAPGVLDEASFPPDRGGEEQGVQGRAVEAFPSVGPGGDDEERRAAWLGLQT